MLTLHFSGRGNAFTRRAGSAVFIRTGKSCDCSGEAVPRGRETGLKEMVIGPARISKDLG